MSESTHENEQEKKQHEWEKQEAVFHNLFSEGAQAVFDRVEHIEQYLSNDHTAGCMDERVPADIREGGPLALLSEEKARAFIEKSGITSITSHSGCGAMKLAYFAEHNLPADATVDQKVIDEYAIQKAQAMAEKYGLHYAKNYGYEDLEGPAEFHIARTIYYVGTDTGFDPHKIPGLLPGLVIHRRYLDSEDALKEATIARDIVFGAHGFGDLFTDEKPLIIIAVGDPTTAAFSSAVLQDELASIAAGNERIKIDGANLNLPLQETAPTAQAA